MEKQDEILRYIQNEIHLQNWVRNHLKRPNDKTNANKLSISSLKLKTKYKQ